MLASTSRKSTSTFGINLQKLSGPASLQPRDCDRQPFALGPILEMEKLMPDLHAFMHRGRGRCSKAMTCNTFSSVQNGTVLDAFGVASSSFPATSDKFEDSPCAKALRGRGVAIAKTRRHGFGPLFPASGPCSGNCGFAKTWHATHCCNACKRGDKEHGPGCAKLATKLETSARPLPSFISSLSSLMHPGLQSENTGVLAIPSAPRELELPAASCFVGSDCAPCVQGDVSCQILRHQCSEKTWMLPPADCHREGPNEQNPLGVQVPVKLGSIARTIADNLVQQAVLRVLTHSDVETQFSTSCGAPDMSSPMPACTNDEDWVILDSRTKQPLEILQERAATILERAATDTTVDVADGEWEYL